MTKIGLLEVKKAMKDSRFRDSLPLEMKDDVAKYLQNPGCTCNVPFFKKLLQLAVPQLKEYYGNGSEINEQEATLLENLDKVAGDTLSEPKRQLSTPPPPPTSAPTATRVQFDQNYSVINCSVEELEKKLADLPKGVARALSISRYEDKITVVITEMIPK